MSIQLTKLDSFSQPPGTDGLEITDTNHQYVTGLLRSKLNGINWAGFGQRLGEYIILEKWAQQGNQSDCFASA